MQGLLKKVFLFFLFVTPLFIKGYTDPKAPQTPLNPKIQEEKKEKSQLNSSLPLKAKIIFYNPSLVFEGKMFVPSFNLSLVTQKNGFDFFKNLSLNEIKTIKIVKWKGVLKDKSQGLYAFYPSSYQITDTNQTTFYYHKNIAALNQIAFETTLGKARFFSYFYDYYKKDMWESTQRKDSSLETLIALPKVIQEIEFLPLPKEEEKKKEDEQKEKVNGKQ